MIEVSVLSCGQGDILIKTEESNPEERKTLAAQIVKLLKQGLHISVTDSSGATVRIYGYDAETNEWVLSHNTAKSKVSSPRATRMRATGTTATAITPIAGG